MLRHFMSERFGLKNASARFSSQSWARFMIQKRQDIEEMTASAHVSGPNLLTSYENQNPNATGSSNLLGNERHGVAESFKLPNRTLCQPRAISLLEVVY